MNARDMPVQDQSRTAPPTIPIAKSHHTSCLASNLYVYLVDCLLTRCNQLTTDMASKSLAAAIVSKPCT
jgi:hypothetical protein